MYRRATDWIECHPKATLSYEDTLQAMRDFQGTEGRRVKQFHSDNFRSIAKAAKTMRWTAPTSTPGIPQTNGLAERKVRQVKEGGRTNLLQAGLDYSWWPYAVTHHCFARNIGMHEGDSAYNKRHGKGHCKAKLIPFGALVNYLPTPRPTDKKRAFESKTNRGLLVGYFTQPGGKWSGDYLVVDFA